MREKLAIGYNSIAENYHILTLIIQHFSSIHITSKSSGTDNLCHCGYTYKSNRETTVEKRNHKRSINRAKNDIDYTLKPRLERHSSEPRGRVLAIIGYIWIAKTHILGIDCRYLQH